MHPPGSRARATPHSAHTSSSMAHLVTVRCNTSTKAESRSPRPSAVAIVWRRQPQQAAREGACTRLSGWMPGRKPLHSFAAARRVHRGWAAGRLAGDAVRSALRSTFDTAITRANAVRSQRSTAIFASSSTLLASRSSVKLSTARAHDSRCLRSIGAKAASAGDCARNQRRRCGTACASTLMLQPQQQRDEGSGACACV